MGCHISTIILMTTELMVIIFFIAQNGTICYSYISTAIIDNIYRFIVEDKDSGYTYTYNPCYPFTVAEGCTNVAVSHAHHRHVHIIHAHAHSPMYT